MIVLCSSCSLHIRAWKFWCTGLLIADRRREKTGKRLIPTGLNLQSNLYKVSKRPLPLRITKAIFREKGICCFFSKMGSEQYSKNIPIRALGGFLSITRFITTEASPIIGKGVTMRLSLIIPRPWNYLPKIPKRSITGELPGPGKATMQRR